LRGRALAGAGGQYGSAYLAEADPGAVRAGGGGTDAHRVAILEEGTALAADLNRLRAVPGELDERSALFLRRAGDGAGGEQVAGAGGGAVGGQMGSICAGDQYISR
jgi:hypothetical protein